MLFISMVMMYERIMVMMGCMSGYEYNQPVDSSVSW